MSNLNSSLILEYPELFPEDFQITCGDGWYELLNLLCQQIKFYFQYNEIGKLTFTQIKEKFSLVRIYYHIEFHKDILQKQQEIHWNAIRNFIDITESISSIICEECGIIKNPKDIVSKHCIDGWQMTLCETCFLKLQKDHKERTK